MSKNNGKSKKGFLHIGILAFIMLFIVGGVSSCAGDNDEAETTTVKSSTGIEEIEFSDSDPLELYVGETDFDHINVDYDDEFSEDDIVFVSSDENVVTISLNRKGYSTVYYDVEAVGAGTATIHAETSDGIVKSEEITVTVAENKVVSIDFPDNESLEFEVGATDGGYVNVDCEGEFSEDDIVFVSSDESVVDISFDIKGYSKVYYDLEAIGAGTATVYAQTADGTVKSEEITITVTEDEEDTTEKATEAVTKSEGTTKEEKTAKQETTTKKSTSRTVYRTPSGKRYHYDADCGGKNSYSVSLDDAKNSGLTPCQKCAQ